MLHTCWVKLDTASERVNSFIKDNFVKGKKNYEEMAFQFDTDPTKLLTMNDKSDMTFEL